MSAFFRFHWNSSMALDCARRKRAQSRHAIMQLQEVEEREEISSHQLALGTSLA
jgi:hypothetical protein